MVSNSDESRSNDRENLPLESAFTKCGVSRIALESFSDHLAYITECLQSLQELKQLVRTCSRLLIEHSTSHKLSMTHIHMLLDIYMSDSEYCWDEIQFTVARMQQTIEQRAGTAMSEI